MYIVRMNLITCCQKGRKALYQKSKLEKPSLNIHNHLEKRLIFQ